MADGESAVESARKEGNYFFKQKQYEAAISAYKKGLDVEPENVLLLSNLAQVYLATKSYAEAEVMATRALTHDPTWYKCYNRAAISAENTGKIEKACDYLKKGIEVLDRMDASKKQEMSVELDHFKLELARMEEQVRLRRLTAVEQPCGLVFDSDNEDSEDYDVDSDSRSVSSMNSLSLDKDNITRSDSLGKVNISSPGNNMDRSRSSSVPPVTLSTAVSAKKKLDMPPPRSTSGIVNAKEKKRNKKKFGPIKMEDLEADPFISFLSTASLVPDDKVEREKFFQLKKKEIKTLLLEGSQALEANVFTAAVEKFKIVYDNLLEFPYQDLGLKDMDVVVIKYLLCFSWVSLAIYEDIIQAIKMMQDMEDTHSLKFPAIYYVLGLAFYKLNRFKSAAMYVEKGLEFIAKNLRLSAYPYPGTVSKPIKETTHEGFENVLTELLKNCRTHHQPNAVCRYEDCRKLSQHIEPSELIFYNDPDFNGFIVVICEEKCRIEYHVQCWKDFKDSSRIQKVTDKDMLGQNCPTKDCVTKKNNHSIITRIEVMGDNAAIKTSLDWSRNTDSVKDARINKRKHFNSESFAEKLKLRSVHEKPKEKEHESVKELRRQEKYRKSELELDQDYNHRQEESTNKNKPEEKQKLHKSHKERQTENCHKELGKSSKVEPGVKIITIDQSEEEAGTTHTKMLRENELGTSYNPFGMAQDSHYGSDSEYIEGEGSDSVINVAFELHDDDCLSGFTQEMLLQCFGYVWSEARETNNSEESELWTPYKAFFGSGVLKDGRKFLPASEIECPEDEVKEFICSYMYEYVRSADSQTVQDIDEKWIDDSDELKMDLSRVAKYQSRISELLLVSPFFAALDNHFGLAEFVPVIYDMLKEELQESYDFICGCSEEVEENADIYNSQEDLSINENESNKNNVIKVPPVESSTEHSSALEVLDNQDNEVFPSSFNAVKWSTEDGVTTLPSQWDVNSVAKQWITNSGQPESLNNSIQNENLEFKEVNLSLSEKTLTALTALLAPFGEDRQSIWTGLLKWTALDSKSHSVSCSVLCTSNVKHVKLSASLWPEEMTMQIVSRDFMEEIGFDMLCQLSDIVTFQVADEGSQLLSQDLGSKFAGFIVNKSAADPTFIVVMYFQNTHTYVGLAPHQCFIVLSNVLADFYHQRRIGHFLAKKMDVSIQTDGTYVDVKLKKMLEENERMKVLCNDQSEKICTLNSTVELLQSQRESVQLHLDAKEKVCAELLGRCSKQERENATLQEKVNNLEKQRLDLESKLCEQVKINKNLESKVRQHGIEKQELEKRIVETEGKRVEDQDQMKIITKKHELSEKLLNKKVEAVEETNKTLRDQLNINENEFKLQLKTLTDKNLAQTEELMQLQQKLATMEQYKQELDTSKEQLKAQEGEHQEQHHTHVQEMWNCKFDAVNHEAMLVQECCKRRIDELSVLVSAIASSGNTVLHNEINGMLQVWKSCLHETTQQLETLKETYTGLRKRNRCGEIVTFPEFNIKLPSQPQNIVDMVLKINSKKLPLLPTPMPIVLQNPSHFAGNPMYYPPFPNSQMYIPQPSGFAQIPGINLANPRHVPAYPINQVKTSEPIPEHSSSVRMAKPPFTNSMQNTRINNVNIIDPATGEERLLADKRESTPQPQNEVESPPPLADPSSEEQPEKKLNTASRLKMTVVQQSLASSNESSMPAAAGVITSCNINPQATSNSTSFTKTELVVTPKVSSAPKPLINNIKESTSVPVQPKPVAVTVPFAVTAPAASTVSSAIYSSVPKKTVPPQPQSQPSGLADSKTTVVKPPSLLDLQTKMPTTQTSKVLQNQRPKSANFQKLLADLRKKYPSKSDEELEVCVSVVRERNNNKLTGLPLPTIITLVGKVLQEQARKKDGGSMGLDKFGTTAWHLKSTETVQWSKPKDTSDEECTICIEPLGTQTTTLYCKHSFHTSCIRTWLRNESVCPICRVYTRMADEFPPLT